MDLSLLAAPFPPASVHWRVQGKPYSRDGKHSAMALAYLDARDVMDRLDEVCGPGGWQSEFTETAKGRIICRLGINIAGPEYDAEWVWKSDGAGDTDVEGDKGGISDALKRAAVSWGIGRYLYRLDSPWVACEVNDKGAWKRWAEDPWSKVRGAPVQRKEEPRQPSAPDYQAIHDRLMAGIAKRKTKQLLTQFWTDEAEARMTLKANATGLYNLFFAAFEEAGKKAHDDKAGQAPDPGEKAA